MEVAVGYLSFRRGGVRLVTPGVRKVIRDRHLNFLVCGHDQRTARLQRISPGSVGADGTERQVANGGGRWRLCSSGSSSSRLAALRAELVPGLQCEAASASPLRNVTVCKELRCRNEVCL